MFKSWVLLFLALFASQVALVAADEDEDVEDLVVEDEEESFDADEEELFEEEEEEEEEEEWDGVTYTAHDDLVTQAYFPDYPDKRIPINKEVTMLVSVTNTGRDNLNISFIGAYLHSPYDINYYIQNFTVKPLADYLYPSAQYTIEYTFKADQKLEPLQYWFSAFIMVNGTTRLYKQTPINGTLDLVLENSDFGLNDVLMWIVSFAIIGGGSYFVADSFNFIPKPKKTRKVVEQGTKDDDKNDWDVDIHTPQTRSKKVGGKRKGKRN